jgi:shikimate 5-dehydrogenase
MKLTWEEIKDIANRLDEIIGDNFHDAMYNTLFLRDSYEEIEVSDEDIEQIKQQLKRIL